MTISPPKSFPAIVASGLGVLQAVFAVIASINGGLTGIVLNERAFVIIAIAAVGVAVLCGAAVSIFDLSPKRAKWLTWLALFLVVYATVIAGLAAVVAPVSKGRPEIVASLEPGSPLILKASVKVSGVDRTTTVNVYVNGLSEKSKEYVPKGPALYQAHIGADQSGNVNDTFSVPIPVGQYEDISVEAWAGKEDPCKVKVTSKNVQPMTDRGCVYLRLVHIGKKS